MMLKIIRLNKKSFFDDLKISNSKIEEIDEMNKNNNLLFLLNKKGTFSISKRKISNCREIIPLFLKSFNNEIDNDDEDV